MDLSDPLQRMYRDCVAAVMNCPIGDYKTLRERKAKAEKVHQQIVKKFGLQTAEEICGHVSKEINRAQL